MHVVCANSNIIFGFSLRNDFDSDQPCNSSRTRSEDGRVKNAFIDLMYFYIYKPDPYIFRCPLCVPELLI